MRAGKTRTTSFSLDETTRRSLKALAERRHRGNVSALLADFAKQESKLAASEAFFEKYGAPPLGDEDLARIEEQWHGKKPATKKSKGRAA